jgi:hypothetical protein
LPRIVKQVFAVVRAKSQIRRMDALVARGAIAVGPD